MDRQLPAPHSVDAAQRRAFLAHAGHSAVALGLAALRTGALPGGAMLASAVASSWNNRASAASMFAPTSPHSASPFLTLWDEALGASEIIGGLPFSKQWHGDWFGRSVLPFHSNESVGSGSPASEELLDVAIIGGGLSGLAVAHALEGARIGLFDLRPRLGGNAMGERWRGVPYSLGSAYFMVPDPGTAEEALYLKLGVYQHARVDPPAVTAFEFGGVLSDDPCAGCSNEERARYDAYRAALSYYANKAYPDIPITRESMTLVNELDQTDFRSAVRAAAGGVLPPLVEASLQAYCYSSFGVGWEQLSAAAGWNFVAAEEFGRLVLPGGNAGLAELLWNAIKHREGNKTQGNTAIARIGATVLSVEVIGDYTHIRWRDENGRARVTKARHAVICCPLHVARHILPQLIERDLAKSEAMHAVHTVGYIVANVLLKKASTLKYYDLFTIHDKAFPATGDDCESDRRITDVVDGTFASDAARDADVLTLYWPLPWHTARFTMIGDDDWRAYATLGAEQIERILSITGVAAGDVQQIRLARFGHAMCFAPPGFYSSSAPKLLQRTLCGRIHFAHQDVSALPAWETCLAHALRVVDDIARAVS